MSIAKKYLKSKPVCRVTFTAPETVVEGSKNICLAGDFNDWHFDQTRLRRQKDGRYATTLDLQTGGKYHYRFIVDGERWESDTDADELMTSSQDLTESVVVV